MAGVGKEKDRKPSQNSSNAIDKKSESQNSTTPIPKENKIDVRAKLAKTAGVSTDTVARYNRVMNSKAT